MADTNYDAMLSIGAQLVQADLDRIAQQIAQLPEKTKSKPLQLHVTLDKPDLSQLKVATSLLEADAEKAARKFARKFSSSMTQTMGPELQKMIKSMLPALGGLGDIGAAIPSNAIAAEAARKAREELRARNAVISKTGIAGKLQADVSGVKANASKAYMGDDDIQVLKAHQNLLLKAAKKFHDQELNETKDHARAIAKARSEATKMASGFGAGYAEYASMMADEAVAPLERAEQSRLSVAAKKKADAASIRRQKQEQKLKAEEDAAVIRIRQQMKDAGLHESQIGLPTDFQGPLLAGGVSSQEYKKTKSIIQKVRAQQDAASIRRQKQELRDLESLFDEKKLAKRLYKEVDLAGLSGNKAVDRALEIQAEAISAVNQRYDASDPRLAAARRIAFGGIQKASAKYLESQQPMSGALFGGENISATALAQQMIEARTPNKSVTGQSITPFAGIEALGIAKKNLGELRAEAIKTMDAYKGDPMSKEYREASFRAAQLQRNIQGIVKDEQILVSLTKEYERINALPDRTERQRAYKEREALKADAKLAEAINAKGHPGKGSAHGLQFAAMNAAYGFQDFFQVLAQPGMGVGRSFLAAANNMGPALAGIGMDSVKATVGIGGLLAGMSALQMLMEADRAETDRLSKSISGQVAAVDKLAESRERLSKSSFADIGSSGSQASIGLFGGISGRSKNIEAISHEIEATRNAGKSQGGYSEKALRNLEGGAEWLFNSAMDQMSWFVPKDKKEDFRYQNLKDRMARGGEVSVKEKSDLFFPKMKTFSEASKENPKLKGQEAEYRRLYDQEMKTYEMRKESGLFAKIQERIDQGMREKQLLSDLEARIPQGMANTRRDLSRARVSELQSGSSGAVDSYVEEKFKEMRSYSSDYQQSQRGLEEINVQRDRLLSEKRGLQESLASAATAVESAEIQRRIHDLDTKMLVLSQDASVLSESLRILPKQISAASQEFELLLRDSRSSRKALSLLYSKVNLGSEYAAREESERQHSALAAKMGILPGGVALGIRQDLATRGLGRGAASSISSMLGVMSDFRSNSAFGRGFAPGAAFDLAEAGGFGVSLLPESMRQVAAQASFLKMNLDELARAEPNAAKTIGRIKEEVDAQLLAKQQSALANDPLMKAIGSVNRFAIEIANLDKRLQEGARSAKARGINERTGKIAFMEESLANLGFQQSLERQQADFNDMVEELKLTMARENMPQSMFDLVDQQARAMNLDRAASHPNEQARRSALGGRVEGYLYGGKSGRILNFQDRISSLQDEYARSLATPGLSDAGKNSLGVAHERKVQNEIAGMVGGSPSGKSAMLDSGSLWQRIQESLSNDPLLRIAESELEVLRQIHEDLSRGLAPSGAAGQKYQEMLAPGVGPQPIVANAGQVGAGAVAGLLRQSQDDAAKLAMGDALRIANQENRRQDISAREQRKMERDASRSLEEPVAPMNLDEFVGPIDRQPVPEMPLFGGDNEFDLKKTQEYKNLRRKWLEKKRISDEAKSGVFDPRNWWRGTHTEAGRLAAESETEHAKSEMDAFLKSGHLQRSQEYPGQNVSGQEQARVSGVSFSEVSQQNAILERIASSGERSIEATNRLIDAVENSGITIG